MNHDPNAPAPEVLTSESTVWLGPLADGATWEMSILEVRLLAPSYADDGAYVDERATEGFDNAPIRPGVPPRRRWGRRSRREC